jgi:N-acetyl-anhydromuramyl-L-alanine amidase AmpD
MKPTIKDIRHLLPIANQGNIVRRDTRNISMIVVHYDGLPLRPEGPYNHVQRYIDEANYHIKKNWGTVLRRVYGFGLMYNYKIAGDGTIYWCQDEEKVLWHANNANYRSLAVNVDCGEGQSATPQQLESLKNLLNWLCYERPDITAGRADVWGHKELGAAGPGPDYGNSTQCPGKVLPYVVAYRKGEWGLTEPEPVQGRDPVSFIAETGFYVGHGFRDLWEKLGKDICGYPITNEYQEDGLVKQDFQKVGMEWSAAIGQPRLRNIGVEYNTLKGKK